MCTATSVVVTAHMRVVNAVIPVIRVVATISYALAPGSLGILIIAVSEQLIRAILSGDASIFVQSLAL